jgi:hypothetical protein
MTDDGKGSDSREIENTTAENTAPDRRELVRKLGKAAILPMVVATFLASDLTGTWAAT